MAVYGNYAINESVIILEFSISDTLKTIKEKVIKTFNNLIDFLQKKVNKWKDSKFKTRIMNLLDRAKKGLNKAKKVETVEDAKELQEEAKEIKEEADLITEEISGANPEGYYDKKEEEKFTKVEKRSGKYTVYVNIKFNDEDFPNELYNLLKNAEEAETYEEYKKYRNEFRNKLKIPNNTTLYGIKSSAFGIKDINFYYVKEGNSISKDQKRKLIHSSDIADLEELKPTWKSNDGRLYDTSRIYFSYIPIDAWGFPVNSKSNKSLYTPVGNYTRIYADTDLSNFRKVGACYIETNEPIKVKQIEKEDEE